MKNWNFKVKNDPQESIKKLYSAFRSADGFVLKMDDSKNDSVSFRVHKQIYYLNLMLDNQVTVNGKFTNTNTENETDIQISFSQHFLTTLYLSIYWSLGLLAIILGIISNATSYSYLIGGILLAIGITLWIHVRKNSERDIQKYKTLISEILK